MKNLFYFTLWLVFTAQFSLTAQEYSETDQLKLQILNQQLHTEKIGNISDAGLLSEYCIPHSNCSFGDGFEDFILNDISNIGSGCSPNGYGDFTDLATFLIPGSEYDAFFKTNYSNQWVTAWIDFNQNFQFEEEEKIIDGFNIPDEYTLVSTQITIPSDAEAGETRLRIRGKWINPVMDACSDESFAETEDYTVLISGEEIESDVKVVSIDINPVLESGEVVPKVTIANAGSLEQSFPVTLAIGDYNSSVQISNLPGGETIQIEFETWFATNGSYTAEACTDLEGDQNPFNDCKTREIGVIDEINAYGFVNYDSSGELEDYLVAFNITNPDVLVPVKQLELSYYLTSMCLVNGTIYGSGVLGEIYTIDPLTGESQLLGTSDHLNGIAFDGQKIYGAADSFLVEVDPITGESTFIGNFNSTGANMKSIATDAAGNLYGIDINESSLYLINKETGSASLVGSTVLQFFYELDMAFDYTNNIAYLVGYSVGTMQGLFTVDPTTGAANFVQSFPNNLQMTAITLTNAGSLLLPPANLQAEVTGDDVVLTWSDVFLGNYIGFNIYRNGALIGTTDQTVFTDMSLAVGIYEYRVSTVYDEGESELTDPVEVTIGNPVVAVEPGSFDEVLEIGESVTRELTIYNSGNIELNYNLNVNYTMQAQSSASAISPEIPENYLQKVEDRFGKEWEEVLQNQHNLNYSPEGILSYCIPTSNCNFGDGMTGFQLAEISNLNSGCSPSGYGDFTGQAATLSAGMTYDIFFSTGYSSNFVNVWIDLNQDEIFSENERLVTEFELALPGELYGTQITIPLDAMNGETRLRVMGSWIYTTLDPCMNSTFGETEDYTVVIGGTNPWISLEPTTGSIMPGDSAFVQVTIDTENLDLTEYMANIIAFSNDTLNPTLEIPVSLTVIVQSLSNFDPVWETPFNPMSIFVVSAQIDSLDMELGDEIGVFDIDPNTGEEICVGAGLVTGTVSGQNILEIVVSMDDGSNPDMANGFTPGNPIIYKLWTFEIGEITDVSVNYPNPGFDEVFTPLGTAIVELNGNAMVMQQMAFLPGWNLISSRAEPLNSNMMTLFQPLIDNGLLEKVIDQNGNTLVYLPYPEPDGKWVNSIGAMSMSEGYYVKVNDFVDVSMYGLPLELPYDIPLSQGWNIMGYPSPNPQDGLDVVGSLINNGNLYKVLDDAGGLIQFVPYPEPNGQWINTIGDFTDGKGYYLKVNEASTLTITNGSNSSAAIKSSGSSQELTFFEPVYQNNPFMPMHIILMTNGLLAEGDEVGIFDGDICVGASVYDGSSPDMSITVTSMDDPDTGPVDGFTAGNGFTIKVYSNGNVYEQVDTDYLEGSPVFAPLESYVGSLLGFITGIETNYVTENEIRVSPNPASESTRIYLTLNSDSKVEISLMNLSGRLEKDIPGTGFSAGNHHVSVDVSNLQPGVYILKVLIDGIEKEILYQKVVVQ